MNDRFGPEVHTELLAALREGCDVAQACKRAGISRKTFYRWRNRGAAGDPEFALFLQRVDEATAEGCKVTLARRISALQQPAASSVAC